MAKGGAVADYGTNIWIDLGEEPGTRGERMYRPPGATLAVALWELDPGEKVEYHFHHGNEETIIVLRGRPTLRTPQGERSSTRARSCTSRAGRRERTV
jgi:uncharacterized cupin superfamily protein